MLILEEIQLLCLGFLFSCPSFLVRDFVSFLLKISIQLFFFLVSFFFFFFFSKEHWFHPKLISLLHRLIRLILWYSLWYVKRICSSFLVSTLSIFQSWFLRDANMVFFSDTILSIISTFIFSFRVVLWYLFAWCFNYYCFAFPFGWKVLVFQYLTSRLLYWGLVDMISYLFVGVFQIFLGLKTNRLLLFS